MKGTLSLDSENLKSSLGSASYYLCDLECVTSVTFSCLKKIRRDDSGNYSAYFPELYEERKKWEGIYECT